MTEQTELCSVCRKPYSARYLSAHRRKQHGIYGGKSGIVRRTPEQVEQVSGKSNGRVPATIQVMTQTPERSFKVVPFLVLEDQDGGLWLAERLK